MHVTKSRVYRKGIKPQKGYLLRFLIYSPKSPQSH